MQDLLVIVHEPGDPTFIYFEISQILTRETIYCANFMGYDFLRLYTKSRVVIVANCK